MTNDVQLVNDAHKAFMERRRDKTAEIRPVDVYKAIIDQIVTENTHSVMGRVVAKGGRVAVEGDDDTIYNPLLDALTADQRKLLCDMLHQERAGAIHDVLASLTWWILVGKVGLTFRGEPMPVELSDMGLHGDFVGRRTGWEWPEE